MKTVKNVINQIAICTIFLLGSVSIVIAKGDVPNIKITQYGLAKLSLVMDGMSLNTEATISLEDGQGFILLTEKVKKKSSFGKIINLKNLPEGNYNLRINTQTRVTIQPLYYSASEIVIDANKRTVIFHPVVRHSENFLDVSWLAGRIASAKVTIINSENATVFEDKIKNVIKVEKRYNVAQLGEGKYTVKVKTPHDTYSHELIIK